MSAEEVGLISLSVSDAQLAKKLNLHKFLPKDFMFASEFFNGLICFFNLIGTLGYRRALGYLLIGFSTDCQSQETCEHDSEIVLFMLSGFAFVED